MIILQLFNLKSGYTFILYYKKNQTKHRQFVILTVIQILLEGDVYGMMNIIVKWGDKMEMNIKKNR